MSSTNSTNVALPQSDPASVDLKTVVTTVYSERVHGKWQKHSKTVVTTVEEILLPLPEYVEETRGPSYPHYPTPMWDPVIS